MELKSNSIEPRANPGRKLLKGDQDFAGESGTVRRESRLSEHQYHRSVPLGATPTLARLARGEWADFLQQLQTTSAHGLFRILPSNGQQYMSC